jgi:hypothetical protein
MTTLNVSLPADTESGSTTPTYLTGIKTGFYERLNADHYVPLTANAIEEAFQIETPPGSGTFAAGTGSGGTHRQVTFQAAIADPDLDTGKAVLYTKTVGGVPQLHFKRKDQTATKPLTTGDGLIAITGADLLASIDDATLVIDADNGNKLTVNLDADTLICDGAEGSEVVRVNVPTAGADADAVGLAVCAWGSYTGNGGNDRTIAVGFTVRHVIVKRTTTANGGVEMIAVDATHYAWGQTNAADFSTKIVPVATGFQVDNDAALNANGVVYRWFATGVRTPE